MFRSTCPIFALLGFVVAAQSAHSQISSASIDVGTAEQNTTLDTASDSSGAKRFLSDPGELVTLYGARRFDPVYEPGRPPPPTDPDTGWPVIWPAPYSFVGGLHYSPYAYRYSPYGYGYYRSYYRPWYVPYGYGYGWGYRYPFGFYPWSSYRFGYRPYAYGLGLYEPWYAERAYEWQSPYLDYGAPILDGGAMTAPAPGYGGCFYW
jgi:hypothetical protein